MLTNKRYTIILSAFRDSAPLPHNMNNSIALARYLEDILRVEHHIADGHYHGSEEVSFVVHTNSSRIISIIKAYAFEAHHQDAVVISYNDRAKIDLVFADDSVPLPLGTKFAKGRGDGLSYTTIDGVDWSVSQ